MASKIKLRDRKVQISIAIPFHLVEKLEDIVHESKQSRSKFITDAILKHMAEG